MNMETVIKMSLFCPRRNHPCSNGTCVYSSKEKLKIHDTLLNCRIVSILVLLEYLDIAYEYDL